MVLRSRVLGLVSFQVKSSTILICNTRISRLSSATLQPLYSRYTKKISAYMQYYEDFIGLTEVKVSQGKVITAEQKFMETQERRRERQQKIQQMQVKLKEIHAELDKTSRGEDRYLQLLTQEHAIIREEKVLIEDFNFLEKAEREYFSSLSLAVRESHEKERAQAEKTKYWSIIGSICGAVIGIVGTSINNQLRMKELRGLVTDSKDYSKFRDLQNELLSTVQTQQTQVVGFLSDMRKLLGSSGDESVQLELVRSNYSKDGSIEKLETQTSELIAKMEKHDDRLATQIKEVKALVAAQLVDRSDNANFDLPAVYVGEDVKGIVKETERNLEWKMKINSLATIVFVYGGIAVTLPFIMQMFKGS